MWGDGNGTRGDRRSTITADPRPPFLRRLPDFDVLVFPFILRPSNTKRIGGLETPGIGAMGNMGRVARKMGR